MPPAVAIRGYLVKVSETTINRPGHFLCPPPMADGSVHTVEFQVNRILGIPTVEQSLLNELHCTGIEGGQGFKSLEDDIFRVVIIAELEGYRQCRSGSLNSEVVSGLVVKLIFGGEPYHFSVISIAGENPGIGLRIYPTADDRFDFIDGRFVVILLLHVGGCAGFIGGHVPTDTPFFSDRVGTLKQSDIGIALDTFHVLSKDVFGFTFAEGLRLDGGLEGETVRHFTNLLEDVFHLLRVGKELLLFAVLLDGDHTAVFAL